MIVKRGITRGARAGAFALTLALLMNSLFITALWAAGQYEVILTVQQTVFFTGSAPPSDAFVYTLVPKTGTEPMPKDSGAEGYTFIVAGTAEVDIGPISFGQPGLYAYEIRCQTNAAAGYAVDRQVYTVEVHVTHGFAMVVVCNEDGDKAAGIRFEHIHAGDGGPENSVKPEPEGSKDIPKTGDDARPALYAAIICLAAASGIAAVCLPVGRRRKKEHDRSET